MGGVGTTVPEVQRIETAHAPSHPVRTAPSLYYANAQTRCWLKKLFPDVVPVYLGFCMYDSLICICTTRSCTSLLLHSRFPDHDGVSGKSLTSQQCTFESWAFFTSLCWYKGPHMTPILPPRVISRIKWELTQAKLSIQQLACHSLFIVCLFLLLISESPLPNTMPCIMKVSNKCLLNLVD